MMKGSSYMGNKQNYKLAKKHKKRMRSVLILSALLAVGALSSSAGWLLKIVLAAALFLIPSVLWFSISMSKAKKYLFEELNPFKYYAVMGVYGKNLTEDNYEFNYAVGNYEKAVSLCLKEMSKTKLKQIEVECKYYLALCYFETENYEKLRIVCDELKAVFSSDKNGKVYKQQYGLVLDYFIDFLNGDYEKCKNIKSCTELTDKKYSNFYIVKAQFYYAVALYKNNEIADACKEFESIAVCCPDLNLSKLSAKYLNSVRDYKADTESYNHPSCEIQKESYITFPQKEMTKGRMAVLIMCLVVLALLVLQMNQSSVGSALDVLYENEEATGIIETVPVNDDGDVLCIYEKDEKIGVAYLDSVGENEYKFGIATTHGSGFPKSSDAEIHCVKAGDSNLKIRYSVTSFEKVPFETLSVNKFEKDNRTYYFNIISIENEYCSGHVMYLETDWLK